MYFKSSLFKIWFSWIVRKLQNQYKKAKLIVQQLENWLTNQCSNQHWRLVFKPELSSPPGFRIQGGWSERDGRGGWQKNLFLILESTDPECLTDPKPWAAILCKSIKDFLVSQSALGGCGRAKTYWGNIVRGRREIRCKYCENPLKWVLKTPALCVTCY